MHTIKLCNINEHSKLIDFIKNEWKEDHIFVNCKEVLDFQHLDKNHYNFIIAQNNQTKDFDAVLGFIDYRIYDNNLNNDFYYTAIWKTKNSFQNAGLGIKLDTFLREYSKNKKILVIGLSVAARKIQEKLYKQIVCKMKHFYIPNPTINTFKIIKGVKHIQSSISLQSNCRIFKADINTVLNLQLDTKLYPYKSKLYLVNKYLKNKFYNYTAYVITCNKEEKAVFISKIIELEGARCMRIVEWYGEYLNINIIREIEQIITKEKCEYIDFLVHTNQYDLIAKMGFIEKDENNTLIPNYFEPYVNENISIYCSYPKNCENNINIFKGDGDQERPSVIKE